MSSKKNETYFAKNKKAYHDYNIQEQFESGICLWGNEVKAIKQAKVNLKGSYVSEINGELFVKQMHVSKYDFSSSNEHDPVRHRKLILKKKEIEKIIRELSQKAITVVPLELYPKNGLIKVKIGICKGKRLFDKRADQKKKDSLREIQTAIKKHI